MLVVFTFYVPQNSGLKYVREVGIDCIVKRFGEIEIVEERGGNIPSLVASADFPVFGITGEDILENYSKEWVRMLVTRLHLTGTGSYRKAVFGLPTLCVISDTGLSPYQYVKERANERSEYGYRTPKNLLPSLAEKKVVIPMRYSKLIERRTGFPKNVEWIQRKGQVDVTKRKDPRIDYAIDIVLSGFTINEPPRAKALGIL